MDVAESWADDRPVNWNETIVFSDEDQGQSKQRDWANESPERPPPEPKIENERKKDNFEQRNYDRRNQIQYKNFTFILRPGKFAKIWSI